MKHRWLMATEQTAQAAQLARQLGITPLLAQCLINRHFTDPESASSFLAPKLRELSDPFLLPGMNAAVDRLYTARAASEAVVVYGDYDVDGVTATALITEVLDRLGWRVSRFLPRRMDEGYGLSEDGVENCLGKTPATLLIAVDCGSTSSACIRRLNERGVDVIVLDHHQLC